MAADTRDVHEWFLERGLPLMWTHRCDLPGQRITLCRNLVRRPGSGFDPLIADVAVSLAGRDAYLEREERNDRSQ